MARRAKSGAANRVRVHIENISSYHAHVQIDRDDYQAAAKRHPDIARHLDVSFGRDFKQFPRNMADTQVLVFMGLDFEPAGFAGYAQALRWIQLTSAGIEHLAPFDWLPRGVVMTNNSGVHAERHGEFGITAVLMLNNNVPAMTTNQRDRRWHGVFGTPIGGKTLVVVGVGQIGGTVARHAKRLGMRVIGVRQSGRPHRHVDEMIQPSELARVMPQADFLIAALPLTAETENLIDERALGRLKPGAGVVNLGRAQTMDYDSLVRRLEQGKIAGAVLDAHDPEPLPKTSPLWRTPNLIVSPHCTSSDLERYAALTLDLTFENLRRFLDGRNLRNRVDLNRGY